MKKIAYLLVMVMMVSSMTVNLSAANTSKDKEKTNNTNNVTKIEKEKKVKEQVDENTDEVIEAEDTVDSESTEATESTDVEEKVKEKKNAEKKQNKKELLAAKKQELKEQYTEEELQGMEEAKKTIKNKYKDAIVLDVDSVVIGKGKIKFDTPPVIKEGRTLVPVRAIVNGFGADVEWNAETKTVIIVKDDITIEMPLDSEVVYVNGEEVVLDAKTEAMNSRTYVPLRFIAETLGLKVSWDGDTDTIEIDDEDTDTEDTDTEDTDTEDTDTEDTDTEDTDTEDADDEDADTEDADDEDADTEDSDDSTDTEDADDSADAEDSDTDATNQDNTDNESVNEEVTE